MSYNIRDLLGHWVKVPPRKNEDGMCPHPCCKGKRPHPDRFPVMLPAGVLHDASDRELYDHFQKESVGRSRKAVAQVAGELNRREKKGELDLRTSKEMRTDARARREEEYRLYLEGQWIAAEQATRGNMVNKKGRAKGVDPRSLWTAGDAARARYASEELRAYWDAHPIVTRREFGSEEAQRRGARGRQESRLYGVY